MPPQRFGATKFRNAVHTVPPRDTWFRTALPHASDSPQNTTVYSSVIKANREHVVTLSPSGDASVRKYSAVGEHEGDAWTGKLGGVLDWDLSRLEGGDMVVAGTDSTVTYYSVAAGVPEVRHKFSVPSKVTNISLHPTAPGLALTTSPTLPVAIYDLASATSPTITLSAPDALWNAAWSSDGRLVAGVSRKGSAYIWDARASAAPVQEKSLSMYLQPLKPVRVAWVGADVFVTSFSKTRARQYSVLSTSSGLAPKFTAAVDNSQGPLSPLVDEERNIVYLAGRGDMTLRQIELSGPMGYQEVAHPLPYALTSGSLAMSHWSTLPVMQAQIASILVPVVDKDGEAILPVQINVPRRQLIDYHGDLYPDVPSSIPQQTAEEWLNGGDAKQPPVSLDPARRGEWEKAVAEYKPPAPVARSVAPVETPAASPAPEPVPVSTPAPVQESPVTATTAVPSAESTQPEPEPVAKAAPPAANANLPALEGDETYSSTAYKVRILTSQVLAAQKSHSETNKDNGPLFVGLQGPQGCGKTTLCDSLLASLRNEGLRVAVLSLDDLYRTNAGLKKLAQTHPDNALLAGRGPPGTHDVELATSVLDAVEANEGVELPVFDKSLCAGEGDRSPQTVGVQGPLDVFVLEGWSFGFAPLTNSELEARYAAGNGKYFPSHSLASLKELNTYLSDFASKVYPPFSLLVQVEPESYEYVFAWRLEQEHAMKASNGGRGMTDEQVHKFVERYQPSYELWAPGVNSPSAPWAGRVVRLRFGRGREVVGFEAPERMVVPCKANTSANAKAKAKAEDPARLAVPVPARAAGLNSAEARSNTSSPSVYGTPAASIPATPRSSTPAAAAPAPAPASALAPAPAPVAAPPPAQSNKSASAPTSTERFNPNWSRKYLGGKSPLNPTYDQIPPPATLHQDSIILRTTPKLALYSTEGPGGRVGVVPLAKKGRVPVGGHGYLSGGVGLVDFAATQYGDKVVLAGEDGRLRVWRVGPDGVDGAGPEPEAVIHGGKVDKIARIAFHPTAEDLLVAATNDFGQPSLRLVDLAAGEEVKAVPLDVGQIYTFDIEPSGARVVLATKKGIAVVDPRDPSSLILGKAHDSLRSFQVAWIDDSHLVSVGFNRGSVRKIILYSITSAGIDTISSLTIDVSPSVLFPTYDPDTSILYIWGKGERAIQAYEIQPSAQDQIARLPIFTGSSPQLAVAFHPKTSVDVRKVEVSRALRLTARTIEEVSFSIPRNKPQFFQDDIYVPTLDGVPVMSAREWVAGGKGVPTKKDLKPSDMTPLSQAPKETVTRKKFVPAAQVMSEEEKKAAQLDALFAKAKLDESSDEDEPKRGGLPPPDDDW